MTEAQEEIVNERLILLTKKDVKNIIGCGQNAIDKLFALSDFPAITIGKNHKVELNALKNYLSKRTA